MRPPPATPAPPPARRPGRRSWTPPPAPPPAPRPAPWPLLRDPPRGGAAEPGRQVERHPAVTAQRAARHHQLHQRSRPRLRIGPGPLRYLVPVGVADRGTAHRAVRETRVQRVVDPLALVTAHHFQLV